MNLNAVQDYWNCAFFLFSLVGKSKVRKTSLAGFSSTTAASMRSMQYIIPAMSGFYYENKTESVRSIL